MAVRSKKKAAPHGTAFSNFFYVYYSPAVLLEIILSIAEVKSFAVFA